MKPRSFHWRVKDSPEIIDEWIRTQSNAGKSLEILVHHFIDKYGMRDVTSYEILKMMHTEDSTQVERSKTQVIAAKPSQITAKARKSNESAPAKAVNKEIDFGEIDVNLL